MHLARDCENGDRMGDPTARTTGLPQIRYCDVSRDENFNIKSVEVGVDVRDADSTRRYSVTFRRGNDGLELDRAGKSHGTRDGESAQFLLEAVLAATEAINRSDTFPDTRPLDELLAEIENRDPTNGYEVVRDGGGT